MTFHDHENKPYLFEGIKLGLGSIFNAQKTLCNCPVVSGKVIISVPKNQFTCLTNDLSSSSKRHKEEKINSTAKPKEKRF